MKRFGEAAQADANVYLTGGASAVLLGWRDSTVDIDISFLAETDDILKAVPDIKEELRLNVELASPPDFIPAVPGWETRSRFIDRKGKVSFYHFDFYSQALSKIERAEDFLRDLGLKEVRARHHDRVCRIEVGEDEMELAFAHRKEIVENLKKIGYLWVSLDLMGLRSGSLNAQLNLAPGRQSSGR